MAQLIFSSGQSYVIQKQMVTVGYEPIHDVMLSEKNSGKTSGENSGKNSGEKSGLLFTLFERNGQCEIIASRMKFRVNGQSVSHSVKLEPCDRVEWDGGSAVYVKTGAAPGLSSQAAAPVKFLDVLQEMASDLQSPRGLEIALQKALNTLVEIAGAEVGCLLSENGSQGVWQLLASRQTDGTPLRRRDLFSNTILNEAIQKRDVVYVESIVGHPWADSQSVIEARIFSAVCAPLSIDDIRPLPAGQHVDLVFGPWVARAAMIFPGI